MPACVGSWKVSHHLRESRANSEAAFVSKRASVYPGEGNSGRMFGPELHTLKALTVDFRSCLQVEDSSSSVLLLSVASVCMNHGSKCYVK